MQMMEQCKVGRQERRNFRFKGNLIGEASEHFASYAFNDSPYPVHIGGTLDVHAELFQTLRQCGGQAAAAKAFAEYMDRRFSLAATHLAMKQGAPRFNPSYLELLRAWGFDSNSPPGAVLKAWVESRFGIVPSFHKEVLARFPSDAWVTYLEEKASGRYHNTLIPLQLDVLYEYCQWCLHQRQGAHETCKHLWRGTNDIEMQIESSQAATGTKIVFLNNLVSFSESCERAEEFGDWILEIEVPLAKIAFFPGLLEDYVLRSEREYLVIGGEYRAKLHRGYPR